MNSTSISAEPASELRLPVFRVGAGRTTDPMITGVTSFTGDVAQSRLIAYQRDAFGSWPQPQVLADQPAAIRMRIAGHEVQLVVRFQIDNQTSFEANEAFVESVIAEAVKLTNQNQSSPIQSIANPVPDGESAVASRRRADSRRTAKVYQRDDTRTKLQRFVVNTGPENTDRSELLWILDQYRPGPLWMLGRSPHITDFTIREPFFGAWDLNDDGKLQTTEMAAIAEFLRTSDRDRDDSTNMTEAQHLINRSNRKFSAPPVPFQWTWELPEPLKSAPTASSHVNHSQITLETTFRLSPATVTDQVNKAESPPISGRVDDGDHANDRLTVSLKEWSDEGLPATSHAIKQPRIAKIDAQNSAIRLNIKPPVHIRFHGFADPSLAVAVKSQCSISGSFRVNQLWSALDINGNGKIGLEERAKLVSRILKLDTDGDGELSANEIPIAMDIVICQGSAAVEQNTNVANDTKKSHQSDTQTPLPSWFINMDQNGDDVVSQDEFLGSEQQFLQLDQDQNGWIDRNETN